MVWVRSMYKRIYSLASKYRAWLKRLRERHPQSFDGVVKFIEFVWTIGTTFCSALTQSFFFAILIMLLSFGALLATQWAILSNRYEHDKQTIVREKNALLIESDEYVNTAFSVVGSFAHKVAHNTRSLLIEIPALATKKARKMIADFLEESLKELEGILTEYYGCEMRASIKFCLDDEYLNTFARGPNNVKSRGGISRCGKQDGKKIRFTDNYAYNAIIKRQLQYFIEGNLEDLSDKVNDDDKFFCEYENDWSDKFLASIVLPIRAPIYTKEDNPLEGKSYTIAGVLCIDCKDVMSEWGNGSDHTEIFAFHVGAFYVDSLFQVMAEYRKKQKKQQRVNKGSHQAQTGTQKSPDRIEVIEKANNAAEVSAL